MNTLREAFNNVIKLHNDIINEHLEASRIESPSLQISQDKVLVDSANR